MSGYNYAIRGPVGTALKTVHTAGGIQADYHLASDRNANPIVYTTYTAMPLHNTPSKKAREILGGRFEEALQLGSSLYLISRESLVYTSGLYPDSPTTDDWFQMYDEGVLMPAIYYVQAVLDLSPVPFAWYILANSQYKISARG